MYITLHFKKKLQIRNEKTFHLLQSGISKAEMEREYTPIKNKLFFGKSMELLSAGKPQYNCVCLLNFCHVNVISCWRK